MVLSRKREKGYDNQVGYLHTGVVNLAARYRRALDQIGVFKFVELNFKVSAVDVLMGKKGLKCMKQETMNYH